MARLRLRHRAIGADVRGHTARFRLTALYCCLFLPSGILLCVITYVLIVVVERPTDTGDLVRRISHHRSGPGGTASPSGAGAATNHTVVTMTLPGHVLLDTRELLVGSCILLVALIGSSMLLGWLAAGRVLRPLRVMTATTQRISEHNLHERLSLPGPVDELKALGNTIDGLLARLEAAFDSQRRFVANASHELRTPLMLNQTILQVALADPDLTLDSLRSACRDAVDAGKNHAQLIDALLTLARSQRGIDRRTPVDLAAVAQDVVQAQGPTAMARGVVLECSLDEARVSGDARLVSTLVSNVVDNAIQYNMPGGRVDVQVAVRTAQGELTVVNTGALVTRDDVARLFEPFQRAGPDRTAGATAGGYGLGLSIVAEIAKVHGAKLDVRPQPTGGLAVTVSFPLDGPA
jgi:signal transduction histidine kinase